MFGNRSNSIVQEAQSSRDTYQATNDLTVTYNEYAQFDMSNFEIYEDDIKDTIQFFHSNIDELKEVSFPDNRGILIEEKNRLNNFSDEGFRDLEDKSLAYFGKIKVFFKHPGNSIYVDMYNSTTVEIQQIINAIRPSCHNFDVIFPLLYGRLITPYKQTDKQFMRIRKFVYIFLHFMYYNCDIGIKTEEELTIGGEIEC